MAVQPSRDLFYAEVLILHVLATHKGDHPLDVRTLEMRLCGCGCQEEFLMQSGLVETGRLVSGKPLPRTRVITDAGRDALARRIHTAATQALAASNPALCPHPAAAKVAADIAKALEVAAKQYPPVQGVPDDDVPRVRDDTDEQPRLVKSNPEEPRMPRSLQQPPAKSPARSPARGAPNRPKDRRVS